MPRLTRNEGFPAVEATEDAAVVRKLYRALGQDGLPDLSRFANPGIEWVHPMVARLPFDGTGRGLPAVLRSAFRRDENGMGPRISAETFVEFGDGVLVVGRFVEHDGTEGRPNEMPFLHECSVRDGRVVRIREYPA